LRLGTKYFQHVTTGMTMSHGENKLTQLTPTRSTISEHCEFIKSEYREIGSGARSVE
jgi:hypothetical protein